MKKCLFILLFSFIAMHLPAQDFEIGGTFGYGKVCYLDHFNLATLFGKKTAGNVVCNFEASYQPNFPQNDFFQITSGFGYQRMGDNTYGLHFFKVPVGFELDPGSTVRFTFGAGFYGSCLFMTTGKVSNDVLESKSFLQGGAYLSVGCKVLIAGGWSLFARAQGDFCLTPLYQNTYLTQYPPTDNMNIHSYDYSVSLGFKYRFQWKKSRSVKAEDTTAPATPEVEPKKN
jgi:hypothetical protein